MLPSTVSLALIFLFKLCLIKVFINEIGISGARDIFVLSSVAQLAFLLQFGKLAKSKNMILQGEIGSGTFNSVYHTVNVIYLATVFTLILGTFLCVGAGYLNIQPELIFFGFAYGYFILQTQLYLLRAEAVGNKQRSYLIILFLNVALLLSFAIPGRHLVLETASLIVVNGALFYSASSKFELSKARSINGWNFYKIESISTLVGLIELPLIASAVGAEEVIIYLLLSRILYMPGLFYGQVSRFLWSDGINHMLGKSISGNPRSTNALYAVFAISGLVMLALGFDFILKFVDEGITRPAQILMVLFSLWALVQIGNRYFKNRYLGNTVFEQMHRGYLIFGVLYLGALVILTQVSNEIAVFIGAKLAYSFLILLYNIIYLREKKEPTPIAKLT